jgi:hypothetical protein
MQNMKELDERDAIAQTTGKGEDLLGTRPWVKHYEQGVPTHLDIPDRPLTWLLDHTPDHYPDHSESAGQCDARTSLDSPCP